MTAPTSRPETGTATPVCRFCRHADHEGEACRVVTSRPGEITRYCGCVDESRPTAPTPAAPSVTATGFDGIKREATGNPAAFGAPAAPSVSRAGQEKASRDMSRNSAEAYIDPTRVSRAGTTGEETLEQALYRLEEVKRFTTQRGATPTSPVVRDIEQAARVIASLRAELERAALDTRRLDWLEDVVRKAPRGVAIESPGMTRSSITLWEPMDDTIPDGWCHARGALTVRAAIDAALSNPGASHVE